MHHEAQEFPRSLRVGRLCRHRKAQLQPEHTALFRAVLRRIAEEVEAVCVARHWRHADIGPVFQHRRERLRRAALIGQHQVLLAFFLRAPPVAELQQLQKFLRVKAARSLRFIHEPRGRERRQHAQQPALRDERLEKRLFSVQRREPRLQLLKRHARVVEIVRRGDHRADMEAVRQPVQRAALRHGLEQSRYEEPASKLCVRVEHRIEIGARLRQRRLRRLKAEELRRISSQHLRPQPVHLLSRVVHDLHGIARLAAVEIVDDGREAPHVARRKRQLPSRRGCDLLDGVRRLLIRLIERISTLPWLQYRVALPVHAEALPRKQRLRFAASCVQPQNGFLRVEQQPAVRSDAKSLRLPAVERKHGLRVGVCRVQRPKLCRIGIPVADQRINRCLRLRKRGKHLSGVLLRVDPSVLRAVLREEYERPRPLADIHAAGLHHALEVLAVPAVTLRQRRFSAEAPVRVEMQQRHAALRRVALRQVAVRVHIRQRIAAAQRVEAVLRPAERIEKVKRLRQRLHFDLPRRIHPRKDRAVLSHAAEVQRLPHGALRRDRCHSLRQAPRGQLVPRFQRLRLRLHGHGFFRVRVRIRCLHGQRDISRFSVFLLRCVRRSRRGAARQQEQRQQQRAHAPAFFFHVRFSFRRLLRLFYRADVPPLSGSCAGVVKSDSVPKILPAKNSRRAARPAGSFSVDRFFVHTDEQGDGLLGRDRGLG